MWCKKVIDLHGENIDAIKVRECLYTKYIEGINLHTIGNYLLMLKNNQKYLRLGIQ